ncbi:hypothetical protein DRO59_06075 [Candidatus Bathyarchaeota archaeon]|nr:MAG: hypothetical protein DRO59_06075 [Candidatus Bathyarchaeota archaeon]
MSRLITHLLSRAVPDVQIESARVFKAANIYWFVVEPDHYSYWDRFRKIHLNWKRIALKYKAVKVSVASPGFCPAFTSGEDLFNWMFDVLELTQGERNLLLLCVRYDVKGVDPF